MRMIFSTKWPLISGIKTFEAREKQFNDLGRFQEAIASLIAIQKSSRRNICLWKSEVIADEMVVDCSERGSHRTVSILLASRLQS